MKLIKENFEIILLGAILFTLPFTINVNSWLIIIFLSYRIFQTDWKNYIRLLKNNKLILSFPFLYLVMILSAVFSSNLQLGMKTLEVQAAFFFFPMLMVGFKLTPLKLNAIFMIFISSIVLSSLYCLLISIKIVYFDGVPFYIDSMGRENSYFSYVYLTKHINIHPTYFSIYVGIALLMLFHLLFYENKRRIRSILGLTIIYFLFFNILLASKSGIFYSLFTITIGGIVFSLWTKNYKIVFLTALVVILGVSALLINKSAKNRLNQVYSTFNKGLYKGANTWDPLGHRLKVWMISAAVIKENWIAGVGAGKSKLIIEEYCPKVIPEKNCSQIKGFGPHNQFLLYLIEYGILGVTYFIYILFMRIRISIKKRDIVYLSFLILILFHFLTESVISVQKGVIIFIVLDTLFLSYSKDNSRYLFLKSKNN